jgi:hypothetical protein
MRLCATFSTSKPTITATAFAMTSRQLTSWTMVQSVRPKINQIIETNLARTTQRTGLSLSRPNFQNYVGKQVLFIERFVTVSATWYSGVTRSDSGYGLLWILLSRSDTVKFPATLTIYIGTGKVNFKSKILCHSNVFCFLAYCFNPSVQKKWKYFSTQCSSNSEKAFIDFRSFSGFARLSF